jgi:hypothetical protein
VITETILNNNDDFEVLQVYSFAAPCATRFGSQIFCFRDVQRSKDALKSAVLDDGWNDATSNVTARDKIHQMLTGGQQHQLLCRHNHCVEGDSAHHGRDPHSRG